MAAAVRRVRPGQRARSRATGSQPTPAAARARARLPSPPTDRAHAPLAQQEAATHCSCLAWPSAHSWPASGAASAYKQLTRYTRWSVGSRCAPSSTLRGGNGWVGWGRRRRRRSRRPSQPASQRRGAPPYTARPSLHPAQQRTARPPTGSAPRCCGRTSPAAGRPPPPGWLRGGGGGTAERESGEGRWRAAESPSVTHGGRAGSVGTPTPAPAQRAGRHAPEKSSAAPPPPAPPSRCPAAAVSSDCSYEAIRSPSSCAPSMSYRAEAGQDVVCGCRGCREGEQQQAAQQTRLQPAATLLDSSRAGRRSHGGLPAGSALQPIAGPPTSPPGCRPPRTCCGGVRSRGGGGG